MALLNKDTIVRALATKHGMTLVKTRSVYEDVLNVVSESLEAGTPVRLTGFGSLKVVDVAARTVRNPQNGELIQISARKRVRFVPATKLKGRVNGQG